MTDAIRLGRRTLGPESSIESPTLDRTVVRLRGATVVERGTPILDRVDWEVHAGRHAAVLGPNGAGKTTVLRLLTGRRHTTAGTVDVLGERIGRTDVRTLRRRIGVLTPALHDLLDRTAAARHLVAAAVEAVTHPTRRELTTANLARADAALATAGVAHLADRRGSQLSAGEWQRVLLARALVTEPELLLLDEPCVGLDLAQRQHFLAHLDDVLARPDAPTTVVVTHHLEELPGATSHALLLRDGRNIAAGPLDTTLTSEHVSAAYGLPVEVERTRGRLRATADLTGATT